MDKKKNTIGSLGFKLLDKTLTNLPDKVYSPTKKVLIKKLIEIENFTDVCGVTFTISRKFHSMDPKDLHRMIYEKLGASRLYKDKNYILIPEFTSKGILHYHGVIWGSYQCHVMKLVNWWRRTYGFVKVELELRNYLNWINYMLKDYGKTGLWTIYRFENGSAK